MRLIELRANRSSFHTVRFNRSGLTLIVGSRSERGTTYNGVGKSLIVELLHFCLGSQESREFSSKLPGWEFFLAFELGTLDRPEAHTVSRSTSKQRVVSLDGMEIPVKQFLEWITPRVFSIPQGVPRLTFRSLIPRFLRRGIADYTDPLATSSDHAPQETLIRSGFLLGLDVHLIARKAELREKQLGVEQLRANFKNDPLLREFYTGARDPTIQLEFLERRLQSLTADRDAFAVAEDYYELQKAADELAAKLENGKNDAFILRHAIENIESSIQQQPEIDQSLVSSLQTELRQAFREEALTRLVEIDQFHRRPLESRISRLTNERSRLQRQLSTLGDEIRRMQEELNQRLRTLGHSRALDQYTAIVSEIASCTAQVQKLQDYNAIELEYSNREAAVDKDLSDEIIRTNSYLEQSRAEREVVFDTFKDFSGRFYPGVPSGISIRNNERSNSIRFYLDVRIESNSSDGINEVRIFCHDLLLLSAGRNHRMKFLFHDSRLYANMDVRQRATLFRLANEIVFARQQQYIATLNPDEVAGMAGEFSTDELKGLINDSITLHLTEDSPAGKLLGIQVDLRNERKHA